MTSQSNIEKSIINQIEQVEEDSASASSFSGESDEESDNVELILNSNEKNINQTNNISVSEDNVINTPQVISSNIIATVNTERTFAFNKISDKDATAKALLRTKECRNVVMNYVHGTGNYGVCNREYCTFAHSLEEYSIPKCSFDVSCRFRLPNRTKKCRFKHSDENEDEFWRRSGVQYPNLPATAEKTRNPITILSKKSQIPVQVNHQPINTQPINTQPVDGSLDKKNSTSKRQASRKSHQSDSGSETSESEIEYRSKRRRQRLSRRKQNYQSRSRSRSGSVDRRSLGDEIVITVPKDMAEIALKAAFERGHYNVKLVTV